MQNSDGVSSIRSVHCVVLINFWFFYCSGIYLQSSYSGYILFLQLIFRFDHLIIHLAAIVCMVLLNRFEV